MYTLNKAFIVMSFSFLFGVNLYNIFDNIEGIFIVILIISVFFLNFYICTKKYSKILFSIIGGIILGVLLSVSTYIELHKKLKTIELYSSYSVILEGEILETYKKSDFSSEYIIHVLKIGDKKIQQKILGLITIPSNYSIKKGEIISTQQKIQPIKNFDNNFEYEKLMYSKNIFFTIQAQEITTIGRKDIGKIYVFIEDLRTSLLKRINTLYPEEEAIFLGGILLGARESLPDELKNDFNNSGLTHFIAVSGFNITILIVFLGYILQFFPPILRIVVILVSLFLFTILVGGGAPVIRASIMGAIAYIILFVGREKDNLSLILFTAVCMVCFSPLSLTYDVSFHLSFLAVIGIIYTQEFFKKCVYFLPQTLAIQEAFVLTLSALSFTLPVMLVNFGQVSILSVCANIAVTWTIPLAMLFGFMSLVIDIFFHNLGVWVAYVTWIFLAWDIQVVHFFGKQDWALWKVDFGIYKHSLQIIYFIFLIFCINFFKAKKDKNSH